MTNKPGARQDRQARIDRATELIQKHPSWGKDKVNAKVKKEFGVGLQRIFVAELKRETLKPTLTLEQKRTQTMVSKGLFPTEAKALSQFPLSAPALHAYLKERGELIRSAKHSGTPVASLNQQIKADWKFSGYTRAGKTDFSKIFNDYANKYAKFENIPVEKAITAPKAVSFDREQWKIYKDLRDHHFSKREAEILATGDTTVNAFNSQTWRDAMTARKQWVENLLRMGWKWPRIREEINAYYRKGTKRTPFDHIRKYDSYKAPKPKADADELGRALGRQRRSRKPKSARRAASRIQYHFGRIG